MKKGLKRLNLEIKNRSYPIVIGSGALQALPPWLKQRAFDQVFVIADVALTIARQQLKSLLAAEDVMVYEIPVQAGESLKDIQSVYPLYGELLAHKANRHSVILALGGGTIGDVAGFVASTYMRGIEWVGLPTTLLAQVDSAVGGKTGLNHAAGKNLIGTFHQPALVICDCTFLDTLKPREMVSGMGEIIKYAIAFDPTFFRSLEKNLDSLLNREPALLRDCIARSLKWKCHMVTQDECDRTGVRETLNFGHTFAHALETATDYHTYQHGEAVLWGMRFAVALSVQRGYLAVTTQTRLKALLARLSVPAIPAKLPPHKIFALMQTDKKGVGQNIRFVLLKKIGQTVLDTQVTRADLQAAYRQW